MSDERAMTREEVWEVYERGARQRDRMFVVMWIQEAVPTPVDAVAGTERMEVANPRR